ncbi:hypothetical protein BH09PAT2_BH09PAT2_09340 [soil metagenome]
MLSKTVRWSTTIALFLIIVHYLTPTAFAETILEIPRSDARIFCADSLTSTPLAHQESVAAVVHNPVLAINPPAESPPQVKPANSLNPTVILELINTYRTSIGKPAFQTDPAICEIAKQRGPALDAEVESGTIHAGFRALNLSYWATENMKYGGNEQEMFAWWMNSPIHRHAIEGDYRYSCGECYGRSCAQIFTNYQPK